MLAAVTQLRGEGGESGEGREGREREIRRGEREIVKEREKERRWGTGSGGKGKERGKEMATSIHHVAPGCSSLSPSSPESTSVHLPHLELRQRKKESKKEARIPLKSSISLH